MYKCVLWGSGGFFRENIHCVKYYEICGAVQVIAITSEDITFGNILGYEHVRKEELRFLDFDFIIVMSNRKNYFTIVEEASRYGITKEKMIYCEVLKRIDCNIEKYLSLKKSPPSIFSNNCWGGLYIPYFGFAI